MADGVRLRLGGLAHRRPVGSVPIDHERSYRRVGAERRGDPVGSAFGEVVEEMARREQVSIVAASCPATGHADNRRGQPGI
jgi:hypothetical protein